MKIRSKSGVNQRRNTSTVLEWFSNLQEKSKLFSIQHNGYLSFYIWRSAQVMPYLGQEIHWNKWYFLAIPKNLTIWLDDIYLLKIKYYPCGMLQIVTYFKTTSLICHKTREHYLGTVRRVNVQNILGVILSLWVKNHHSRKTESAWSDWWSSINSS